VDRLDNFNLPVWSSQNHFYIDVVVLWRYLATGVVSGRTKREVRNIRLPDQETLEHIDRIHPDKLNNFYQVVSVVCANIPGDAEDEAQGVSTDEESVAALPRPAVAPQPHHAARAAAHHHAPPPPEREEIGGGGGHSRLPPPRTTPHVSIDAYELEREQARLAKATECQNNKRRMSYDRGAREEALARMKLPNQLMWKCVDCQISCAKPGMEKHIMLKGHWDRVLENYSRALDGAQQQALMPRVDF
jgi:hypothetical protein